MIEEPLFICLGKRGDVLNLLPILWDEAQQGKKPHLMVCREYADFLDGCSYIETLPWDGDWQEIRPAFQSVEKRYSSIRVCQVAGRREDVMELSYGRVGLKQGMTQASSFIKEQWRIAGRLHDWKRDLPLVFDRRDDDRELELRVRCLGANKKTILLALGGETSPYKLAKVVKGYLQAKFRSNRWNLVDLSEIQAERLYDLLTLYENAHCLITCDSALLHLAWAVPSLPVGAFIQDSPSYWHGSPWRQNQVATIRYDDHDSIPRFIDQIANVHQPGSRFYKGWKEPKILHVWTEADAANVPKEVLGSNETLWSLAYASGRFGELRITDGQFGRNSKLVFQDAEESRAFPYVRDVLRAACQCIGSDDWILLCRAAAKFSKREILHLVAAGKPFIGKRVIGDPDQRPIVHSAADLFCFKRSWWEDHREKYPDILMGTDPYWHRIMMELLLESDATVVESVCWRAPSAVIPTQPSAWRQYNGKLAGLWLKGRGLLKGQPHLTEQIHAVQINPEALFQWGYNPSLIQFADGYLLAYRAHRKADLSTCLAMARLDPKFNVRSNEWMDMPLEVSTEDPRFFWHKGEIWLSYVSSNWPSKPTYCGILYGPLRRKEGRFFVEHPRSLPLPVQPRALEKNWIFFEWQEELFCIYEQHPEQCIFRIRDNEVVETYRAPGVSWAWGLARGGTTPLPYKNGLLRLFHSRTDNDFPPVVWRYHLGSVLLEPKPPFAPLKVSKVPICSGSMEEHGQHEPRCFHAKKNIIFPAGWIQKDDRFTVSLGVNDCASYLATIETKDLKL